MKNLRNFGFLFVLVAAGVLKVAAADVKIIANPAVTSSSISADDLKAVFLGTKSSLAGTHVEPVLEKGGSAHESFLKQYLGKTDSALQMYYRSLVFTGKGAMPKALSSDAEVIEFVGKTKGAIGYVSSDANTAAVKAIEVK